MNTPVELRLAEIWETPHTLGGWFSTVDHKKIGKRYLATAMWFVAEAAMKQIKKHTGPGDVLYVFGL